MKNWKWIWVIIAVLFYQANDITLRIITVNVNFISGCIVQAIPLVVVSGVFLCKEQRAKSGLMSKKAIAMILSYGAAQVLFGNLLYFVAMKLGGLSVASPMVQSQAIWAVLLGAVFLKEYIPPKGRVGVGCFVVGIAVLSYFKSYGAEISGGWLLGAVCGILAGLCWATGSLLQKILFKQEITQNTIFFIGTLFGIMLLSATGLITDRQAFLLSFSSVDTYKMLIPGAFSSIATWCFAKALKRIPISVVIPILAINIIFNTITGAVFWKEFISVGTIFGLITAFIGIILSQDIHLSPKMPKYKSKQG